MTPPTRIEIFKRGTLGKCPRCGRGAILKTIFIRNDACPHCRMHFAREDGFFLAATAINYGLVCVGYLLPLLILWLLGWLPNWLSIALCLFGVLALPVLLYRYSQSLWLGLYYAIVPGELDEGNIERPG
jgi:uncharacterized protein (DUF983 family)